MGPAFIFLHSTEMADLDICADTGTSSPMTNVTTTAEIFSFPTKAAVGDELCRQIVNVCQEALRERGVFTVAMSGGSLPALLSNLPQVFKSKSIDPQFTKWHVLLADERGVPDTHKDSNLLALKKSFLDQPGVSIPSKNIYGINNMSLGESIEAVAMDYETKVISNLAKSGGHLDLALLGMGEDGHTCSLFPNHPLLQVRHVHVAAISDSPKPPPHRITLTFKTLELTRHVVFCGTGPAKSPILREILQDATKENGIIKANVIPKYPCGMVRPLNQLVYIVDDDAMNQVEIKINHQE